MSVNERHQAVGSWSLQFDPATPKRIYDLIDLGLNDDPDEGGFYGHIIITPTHLDHRIGDAAMLAASRYTGVVRELSAPADGFTIGGPGLAVWLGDEDGAGPVIEEDVTLTDGTLEDWVDALLAAVPGWGAIIKGSVTDTATTLTHTAVLVTIREALDYVCRMVDAEWRVNPDGTLDAGPKATLWPSNTTPTVVVTRKEGSREPTIRGLETRDMAREKDARRYATRVVAVAESVGVELIEGSADVASNPYKDLHGNDVVWTRIVDAPETLVQNADDRAQAELDDATIRAAVPLSTDTYDVGGILQPGDAAYVFDPLKNISDTANSITYRGARINPAIQRLYATTWPIEKGMGVYFRDWDAGYHDVTEFAVFEAGSDLDPTVPDLPPLPPDPLLEGLDL